MRSTILFLMACFSFTAVGCGGPKLVPAEGVITLDGEPLAWATIILMPEPTGPSYGAGFTDEDGHFYIQTREQIGILPGKYKVTVSKTVAPTQDLKEMMTISPPVETLPPIYHDYSQTTLKTEIPPTGTDKLNFALKVKTQ